MPCSGYDTVFSSPCQQPDVVDFNVPLVDTHVTLKGKPVERPWRVKKNRSVSLAKSYARIAGEFDAKEISGDFTAPYSTEKLAKKANRVYHCSNDLGFVIDPGTGDHRLRTAGFCRDRLCPLCTWRKSIIDVREISVVFDGYESRHPAGESEHLLVAVNFGLRNCKPEALSGDVDLMFQGFKRLQDTRSFRDNMLGFFRHMELTLNFGEKITEWMWRRRTSKDGKYNYYESRGLRIGDANPWHNTYNPHFHCIFVLPRDFYETRITDPESRYLQKKYWTDLWRKACRLDYDPMVWTEPLRRFKDGEKEGKLKLAEFAKYPVKDQSIFDGKLPRALYDEVVITLASSLRHRKLIHYGGILRDIYKEHFGNKDPNANNVDLINVDGEEINPLVAETIVWYKWDYTHSNYFRIVLAGY